jgi:hypothetical protein
LQNRVGITLGGQVRSITPEEEEFFSFFFKTCY